MAIAPVNNSIRKAFAPYFRARWQNYQNVVSNAEFFTEMPAQWLTYQNVYVKQWEQWSSGFVLMLHRGDFFATGMGKTVCDIMTRECVKGGFRLDGKDDAQVKFMTNWGDKNHLIDVIGKGFNLSSRLGNAILRLNVCAGTGECYPTVHGINRTYFEINRRNEVVKARFIDYLTANTTKGTQYYVIEDRIFFDNEPFYRVQIYEMSGLVTAPTFCKGTNGIAELDAETQSKFADAYGDIEQGEWYKLPFATLGCYNWQTSATNAALTDMPGYSESILHTALDLLYSIDYNYSLQQLDLYWGRTRVLTPKEMATPRTVNYVHNGQSFSEAMYELEEGAPLADDVFLQTPSGNSLDAKVAQPIFIQPDYREESHKALRDADLELLASKVGLSSTTLANHLAYNTSKTATEVDAETDTTDTTVNDKRRLANLAINALLADALAFYGFVGDVDITWNNSGQSLSKAKDGILAEYSAQLMPRAEAIKRLHPELTQAEVDEWVAELDAKDSLSETFDINKAFV